MKNPKSVRPEGARPRPHGREIPTWPAGRRNPKLQGITLMEIITAIFLLTLVILVGSAIYLSGWNLFRNAQFRAQAARNATVPMMHMIKNLTNAINFTKLGTSNDLTFRTYTDITNQTIAERNYSFIGSTIEYDDDTSIAGGAIIVGNRIQNFNFVISKDSANDGIIVEITITATDNNNNNSYIITSIVEARYGSVPPV